MAGPILGGLVSGMDRILTARMQSRIGPPLLQPFYDVVKLLFKEPVVVNVWQAFCAYCYIAAASISVVLFFLQSDLLQKIGHALQKYALDASNLSIEITESMIMENIDSAVEVLKQLQAMGVHIHIDDFGTGYSSLSYLQRFPVNALKIDRSFVDKMHIDKENLEIVKAIVSLAGNLKLDLIAEGLEKTDQLVRLRELNCAYGQGFLLSRPMDAAAAESWMQKKFQDMTP